MNEAVPLLPPICLHGVDRYKFTFDLNVFGSVVWDYLYPTPYGLVYGYLRVGESHNFHLIFQLYAGICFSLP
jgi:hypothetical protein